MKRIYLCLLSSTAHLLAMFVLVAIATFILDANVASADAPRNLPTGRWIGVDLTTLTATAYQWDTPVYTAPVTTGKPGWETPTGTFYVQYRVVNETMDSATVGIPRWSAEGYYLPNVRYTQYFTWSGYALHANYWMPDYVFGKTNTSHGCVGMRERDAAYFWNFATVGTPVIIYRGQDNAPVLTPGEPKMYMWVNEAD